MTVAPKNERRGEQGSSLFEVTLAMGLMAFVLGSIAGLFVIGAGQVRSGRAASEALAVAHSMVEEMQGWSVSEIHTRYGCAGDATVCAVSSSNPSVIALAPWRAKLESVLPGAEVSVGVTPLEPTSTILADSTQLRVQVTVRWSEGSRNRRVRLATVRI
jgi:hypothetical protein